VEKSLREKIGKALEKAEQKLNTAEQLLDTGAHDDAISRAYYSMFHAVSALLMLKALETRTHSGLVNLFGQHFVNTGEFEPKFGRMLSESKELRENGDYEIFFSGTKEEAELTINNAKELFAEVSKYIQTR